MHSKSRDALPRPTLSWGLLGDWPVSCHDARSLTVRVLASTVHDFVGCLKALLRSDEAVAAKNAALPPAIASVLKDVHANAAVTADLMETTVLLFAMMAPCCTCSRAGVGGCGFKLWERVAAVAIRLRADCVCLLALLVSSHGRGCAAQVAAISLLM